MFISLRDDNATYQQRATGTRLPKPIADFGGMMTRYIQLWLAGGAVLALGLGSAIAQDAKVAVDLNKLEPVEKGCRAYVVIDNTGQAAFDSLKLDLVLFRTDGVIGRRFAAELGPLKSTKKTVKLFDITDTPCDQIGQFLVNEVVDCKVDGSAAQDCLDRLSFASTAKVQIGK